MAGGYEYVVLSSATFATGNDRAWDFAKSTVAHLKGFSGAPWITRGSSIGSSWSATPDGVDFWSTGVKADAAGTVWHVLESTVSGLQICLEVAAAGGLSIFRLTVAKNKFETGGAWRGGGTGVGARPEDLTSSPAADREVNMVSALPSTSGTGYKLNWANRLDGEGFLAWYWADDDDSNLHALAIGFFRLVNAHAADTNPWCVFNAMASGLAEGAYGDPPSSLGATDHSAFWMRKPDGSTCAKYIGMDLYHVRGSILDKVDPHEGKPGAYPVALISDLPLYHYRGSARDVFLAWTTDLASIRTFGSKSYIKLGVYLLPWNDVTTKGIDQPFFFARLVPTEDAGAAPTVTNLSPAEGVPLAADDTVAFDVTCASGSVGLDVVYAQLGGSSAVHVVWDGESFTPEYSGSSRSAITSGNHYVLRRDGGWQGTVRITVKASGNTGAVLQ